jgi:hypothetical protein
MLASGLAKGVPLWAAERPATTVACDRRVHPPGHKQNSSDPPDRYEQRRGANAVRVTTTQAAVLQGFDPRYPWRGPRTRQFEQIGNAVPPPRLGPVRGGNRHQDRKGPAHHSRHRTAQNAARRAPAADRANRQRPSVRQRRRHALQRQHRPQPSPPGLEGRPQARGRRGRDPRARTHPPDRPPRVPAHRRLPHARCRYQHRQGEQVHRSRIDHPAAISVLSGRLRDDADCRAAPGAADLLALGCRQRPEGWQSG